MIRNLWYRKHNRWEIMFLLVDGDILKSMRNVYTRAFIVQKDSDSLWD